MLVSERLTARIAVSAESITRHPEHVDGVYRELWNMIRSTADERAYRVRPESVHVHEYRRDERSMSVLFEGVWSPAEARFVGGEYDGDTAHVHRDERSGMPLEILRLPYRGAPYAGSGGLAPGMTEHPSYERSGIDPIDDVWVYTFIPTRR